MAERFAAGALRRFAAGLLERAGLAPDRAATLARLLVEADLMGRTTHGLALLPRYLDELAAGTMQAAGEPEDRSRHEAALVWDGRRLPGPWLLDAALAVLIERSTRHPVVSASIRRAHHTACLGAHLPSIAARGLVGVLMSADPVAATVAPPGGRRGAISGNPLAACVPTASGPILMDFSLAPSFGQIRRQRAAGGRLAGAWLLDPDGNASDDPAVLGRGGALLPLGGLDMGHKGFALGLLVDLLCSGLAGFGRADAPSGWQANAFAMLLNPEFFAGLDALVREAGHVAAAIRAVPPRGAAAVRAPGDAARAARSDHDARGIPVDPALLAGLAARAGGRGAPEPLG